MQAVLRAAGIPGRLEKLLGSEAGSGVRWNEGAEGIGVCDCDCGCDGDWG